MITAERCRELLNYDPITGAFTWRINQGQRGRAGMPAGRARGTAAEGQGYMIVQLDRKKYPLHRLAWLYMMGSHPAHLIDHVDGNRTNNAFANLRPADRSINSQNIKGPRSDNLCGLLGASRNGRGWKACINLRGKRYYLGTFDTAEEASRAYLEAKRKLHPANTL